MKGIVLIGACLAGAAVVIAAGAAGSVAISQTSIGGAKLGLSASAYKQLLGRPVSRVRGTPRNPGQPEDWSRLVFSQRKLSVYFIDGLRGGTMVATWNKSYRTAAGIGPCSTVKRLKAVYGTRLKPSKFSTQNGVTHAWTVGENLIFASNDRQIVEVIGLFDGSDPAVGQPGGSLSYAGFVALSETRCS
jgi:hypothetical protein